MQRETHRRQHNLKSTKPSAKIAEEATHESMLYASDSMGAHSNDKN